MSAPGTFDEKLPSIQFSGNSWSRLRANFREPFAEFVGTGILTLVGIGVNCQTALANKLQGANAPTDWISVSIGWGTAAALAVWVSGGISGGHINPAVTLALATFRDFPWKKVPIYIISQLLGAIVGSAIAYANYFHAIDVVEGGWNLRTLNTAGLFALYPHAFVTDISAFFSEFLCTAILMIGILAMLDKSGPPNGLGPLVIFITFVAIAGSFGIETGFGMNPARDLGPRIITAMVGYGNVVFNFRRQYWLWCEILAPILGAQAGTLAYDVLIYTGEDSVVNKSSNKRRSVRIVMGHNDV